MPLDQPDEDDYADDPDAYRAEDHYGLSHDQTMPLGDHIEELRSRLVKMLIGVGVALVITAVFGFQIIGWLAQPLLHVQNMLGVPAQPIQTDPAAGFTSVFMRVILIAAIIIAAPWIIWQGWQFVVVGLYEHEKRAVHILAPFSSIMTALAVLFTYYILLPLSLAFFINFVTYYPEIDLNTDPNPVTEMVLGPYRNDKANQKPPGFTYDTEPIKIPILETPPKTPSDGQLWFNDNRGRVEFFFDGKTRVLSQRSTKLITPLPAMNEYIKFATFMMLGSVVAFQLPVIMLVLGWSQIFDPRAIGSVRKYALFVCFALGALLTPADPFSMLMLAVPLYLLFEFGLLLMKLTYNRKNSEMPDEL